MVKTRFIAQSYMFISNRSVNLTLNDCNIFVSRSEKLEIIALTIIKVTPLLCSCKFN